MDGFRVFHLVNRVGAYCRATGRQPAPGCNPHTFLDDVNVWWQATRGQKRPFPPSPFAPPRPGLEIEPIRTGAALYEEGRAMHHCAAKLLPNVVSGEWFFYAVQVGTERLTLAIEPSGGGYFRIVDLRALSNRLPTAHARSVVERWVMRLWQLQAMTA